MKFLILPKDGTNPVEIRARGFTAAANMAIKMGFKSMKLQKVRG